MPRACLIALYQTDTEAYSLQLNDAEWCVQYEHNNQCALAIMLAHACTCTNTHTSYKCPGRVAICNLQVAREWTNNNTTLMQYLCNTPHAHCRIVYMNIYEYFAPLRHIWLSTLLEKCLCCLHCAALIGLPV